jgi:hypothetical protein
MKYFDINQKLKLMSMTEREGGEKRERKCGGERERERKRERERERAFILFCVKNKIWISGKKKSFLCALMPLI